MPSTRTTISACLNVDLPPSFHCATTALLPAALLQDLSLLLPPSGVSVLCSVTIDDLSTSGSGVPRRLFSFQDNPSILNK